MWHSPATPDAAQTGRRVPVVAVALATVTMLAVIDGLSAPHFIILGTLTTGPCLAAGSGRPRAVLALGAYVLVLINVLSWGPDQIWGSDRHALFNVVAVLATGVGMGIAHQLRAVERARESAENERRMLAAIVAHSDDAILAATTDGRLTAFNGGAERLYGYSAADVVGLTLPAFGDLVIPADAPGPSIDELRARIVGGEPGVRFDSRRKHRDGTVKDVSVAVSPVRDEHGAMVGVSWVIRDISAQRRAEELAQRSQRMASLGQLAGGVAHDFNNILGIMLSFTAFAEENSTDPDVRADLAKARLAGERAVGLTRQLLTFTRQDTTHPEALDLNSGIAEVCAMLTRTIDKKIELIARTAPEPLMIYADAGQIQQILLNLAVNARDAMPDGGTLIIEATEAEPDGDHPDLPPAPAGGRYIRLLVSDTGIGMSAEVAARVFEPFYTTKPKGSGTGLGLATVYGIVTEAGGSINVYSEPELGTTFRVYFPAAPAGTPAVPAPAAAAAPPDGGGRTVLVVDDEPELGDAVARILRSGGYRTLSARGGAQALALDAVRDYDLLLTDIIMPGMSGRRLAATIQESRPDLPVLYMSGYSDGLVGDGGRLDDEIAFIEKPFTADQLLTRVGAMCRPGLPARHPAARSSTAPVATG
ncbi:ATP-binding protein [Actinoplanes sp. NPDC049599]|uniref:hybrid sensor histidine kinase/response regulator n=1 Tax=Actinoplanes sp. NPDC049599 TaxID=3363903 RepID=UPI0037AF0A02